ncbi:energy transducer TonB [Arsenophonus nasoniae]|uniref:Energy transducer TonB n=1 Tax=Arsenophonus nasoniae TaxID=638 RepID=A0AA95GBW9_9GAMM|nr:energy transducer TonB [Arsenophonus nasoniae]WGL95407.1 energy transducer TonB [Arsenophonus nasoniae]
MIRLLAYIVLSIILHTALIWLCLSTSANSTPTLASDHNISPNTTITLVSASIETISEINRSSSEAQPMILPDSPINPVLTVKQKQEKINDKKKITAVKKTNNKTVLETKKKINKNKNNNPSVNSAVNFDGDNNTTMQGGALNNEPSPIKVGERKEGERYYSLVKQEIERNKIYPRKARKQRHRGRVLLQFNINTDGSLYDAKIIRSSGFNTLDKAALTAIAKSRSIGPKPIHISSTMSTEIEFNIDRN